MSSSTKLQKNHLYQYKTLYRLLSRCKNLMTALAVGFLLLTRNL